jgi:hypothetical protein
MVVLILSDSISIKENDMGSDLLDEFCEEEFGHADWARTWDADGNMVVTFYKEARQEYLDELEEEEDDETEC